MSSAPSNRPGPAHGRPPDTIWTLSLWGLPSTRGDRLATLATVALLAPSRFALLPSGPWDWDETLFARGILDFDLPGHYPHPPGFPLWMLLGWLVHFVVSEPLVGLQLLSATASCLTLWPLAALGRRVAPPPVAAAAALVMLFAPGVWLHAPRGFSCTPATLFALWAAALALRPADSRPVTAFTALVTAAFLIRPILLPSLGLLWLAGIWTVTPRRRLLPGLGAAAAAVLVAVAGMVVAQGSWSEFARSFLVHGRRHTRNLLGNTGGFAELGIVKGLGGPILACVFTAVVLAGLVVWLRRVGRRSTLAWVAVLTLGIGQLIWLQNRTFSRYAVPYQMTAAPLLAGAAALLPPTLGAGLLLASATSLAATSFPAVAEQHTRLMPGWQALRFAADLAAREGYDLVVEPGLFPFASYLAHAERAAGRPWPFQALLAPSSPDAASLPRGRYLLVTDLPGNYLTAPWERRWRWQEVGARLRPLTSGRFLNAAVIDGAMVPIRGFWPAERSGGETFIWGEPLAELLLPPLALEGPLGVDLLPARGDAPLAVRLNGFDIALLPGDAPRLTLPINPAMVSATAANRLQLSRERGYPPGGGDSRPLAVRLFGFTQPIDENTFIARERLAALLAESDPQRHPSFAAAGLYRPERFPRGRGTWTQPQATFDLPLAAGILTLTVWAPRPGPVDLVVDVGGTTTIGPLAIGRDPQDVSLILPGSAGQEPTTRLSLGSRPYTPASEGSRDTRTLGVVVGRLLFTPTTPSSHGWMAVPDREGSALLWASLTAQPPQPQAAVGWQRAEAGEQEYFVGGDGALMPLPGARAGDRFVLEVSTPPTTDPALVEIDGRPAAVLLPGLARVILELPAGLQTAGAPSLLTVRHAREGSGKLAVHLHSVAVRRSGESWGGPIDHPLERARLGVRLTSAIPSSAPLRATGLHHVEPFLAGTGAWTFPRAELTLPSAGGLLRLTLAAPRPTSPELELTLDGRPLAGPLALGSQPQDLVVALPSVQPEGKPTLRLGLRSVPFVPASRGGSDSRELGVVLLGGEQLAPPGSPIVRWLFVPPASGPGWTVTAFSPGTYGPERFGDHEGCWTVPRALLTVPPGDGVLTLTAWAARPSPSQFEIWRDGSRLLGPLDLPNHPTQLEIPLHPRSTDGREIVLELRSAPYSPRRHHGSSDDRELGVVLSHLAFRPPD